MAITSQRNKFYLIFFVLLLTSCGGNSSPEPPPAETCKAIASGRGELAAIASIENYTVEELKTFQTVSLNNLFIRHQDKIQTGVSVYKVSYKTVNPAGDTITASGILFIPATSSAETTSIISYQHGTTFSDLNVPSNQRYYRYMGAIIASMDHIVVMPDYIGYGDSINELHPYLHAESLANATIDLIKAVKTYLVDISVATNGQLLLGGFSEGAYVAVATHKMLQECYTDELAVTATSAGAGPYDLATTSKTKLDQDTVTSGATVAFVYTAYDSIYDFNRLNEVFNEPYATYVNTYFDGTYDDSFVRGAFTNEPATLFKEVFLSNFRGDGEAALKQRLAENNVYDWKPTSPIRFFHGPDDVNTPYANSVTAVDTMQANGATGVELVNCNEVPSTHSNCTHPYFEDMLDYLLSK